jgi:hypothetical protein
MKGDTHLPHLLFTTVKTRRLRWRICEFSELATASYHAFKAVKALVSLKISAETNKNEQTG